MTLNVTQDTVALNQSIQIIKAEKERDMHKWQSEKLQLAGHMNELTESLRQKDKEAAMNETRIRQKFDQELENVEAGYEDQYDEL